MVTRNVANALLGRLRKGRLQIAEAGGRRPARPLRKLVSIEMIEAVGWQYFETFFRRWPSCSPPAG